MRRICPNFRKDFRILRHVAEFFKNNERISGFNANDSRIFGFVSKVVGLSDTGKWTFFIFLEKSSFYDLLHKVPSDRLPRTPPPKDWIF